MGPDLWELFEDGKEDDEVAAIIRLGRSAVFPKGVRVVTQFSEIITVRMTRGNIPKVSGAAEVDSMIAGDAYLGPDVELETAGLPELSSDTVLPTDERRPKHETATGRGVVVGVVDWGFDFAHPDFRNKDGSTRIVALWDQRGSRRPGSPQPFGYGIVHDREAINRALKAKDPYAALGYHPADADTGIGCHGTHVASIAAGSGGEDRPTGIAPEADLVLVHNAPWDEAEPSRLGDSVTLLEGIDFIARTAGDRTWAINLSMGRHSGSHAGLELVEQGFDAAVRSTPGRAICLSAGNYFDKRVHASGQLRPTQERTLVWQILEGKPTYNQLEFWYSWQDKLELAVRSPDGALQARVKAGERAKLMVGGKEVGNVYHRGQDSNSLNSLITIFLYREAPSGSWEVTLFGTDVINGRYHAWIERDVSCPKCQSRFRADDADPRSTTGTICNGLRTFAVGAFNNHDPEQRLGRFSSSGPTFDDRLKPDLCAPGVSVLAARSATRDTKNPAPPLTRMSGTSMAAPHVTGTIALMFQAAPRRLRIEETHNLLLESARRVSLPEEIPDRVGIGFLDVIDAVDAARKIGGTGTSFKQTTVHSSGTVSALAGKGENFAQEEELLESELEKEAFEGKAEAEYEALEADQYQNSFHRIANDITSAFEGGKAGTLNLYDLGIISYGKHQATLASGTLLGMLKRFTELSSSQIATRMSSYLDRVKRRDETLREDADFIRLLKEAAKELEMERAQDEEFSKQYWEPAKSKAAKGNIKSALGHVIFYDTRVQGGLDQVQKKAEARLGGKVGDTVGAKEITEQESLRIFMDERIQRHLRISTSQKKKAEELNQEAGVLEDIAATDPERADHLKCQAGEKRKKAKQYSANAAALEVSANKTRGPSLMALVDSGDLNLYDGEEKKIYLKGKRGVAIDSLNPGAAIDATTSAELELTSADAELAAGECASDGSVGTPIAASSVRLLPELGQLKSNPTELIEIADQVVRRSAGRTAPVAVLHEMLSLTGTAETLAAVNSGFLPSAAEIFDSLTYPGGRSLREQLMQNFEVVARAGAPLQGELREGDVMVRRGDGNMAHVSVIATPQMKDLETLLSEGLTPESYNAGNYAQVVETGVRPHTRSDQFARQLTDSAGRLLNDIILLRLATPPTVVNIQQPSKTAAEPGIEGENSSLCARDISEFGRAWRTSHDARRNPRPQWAQGRDLCAGEFDLQQSGSDGSSVDLLLFNFDIDGSYPKVQHETALDHLMLKIHERIVRNPPADPSAIAYEVLIQGYADRTGSAQYNEILANDREAAVEFYLRINIDRNKRVPDVLVGPRVRYIKMKGGFAPDAPPGKSTPHARSVLVWAVPVGAPKPQPRSLPPTAPSSSSTLFDELTDFVRHISIGLTADSGKVLAPPARTGALFSAALSDPMGWTGTLVIDGEGAVASSIKFPLEMLHGGASHVMPTAVFDTLAWKKLALSDAGFTGGLEIVLPLTNRFILASAQASSRRVSIRSGTSDTFPLATEVQTYATAVLGYIVDGQTGVVDALDLSKVPSGQLKQFLANHGELTGMSSSKAAIVAVYDLALASPKDDFQPKDPSPLGPAEVARTYPLLSVWSSRPLTSLVGSLEIVRPTRTPIGEMAGGGRITNALYTDMNASVKTLWECLSPALKAVLLGGAASPGLLPVPISPLVIKGLRSTPCTRWDSIFAHYKLDATLSSITVVSPAARWRVDRSARQEWNESSGAYVTSGAPVAKVERQGMFDNLHIAPAMDYKGAAAFMAPICHHDCLHIHWRWGESYRDLPMCGWSGGKPYRKPGAPMIPENQTLKISVRGSAMSYLPIAENVPAQSWQIFMHHGTGYVSKLTAIGAAAPLLELAQMTGSLPQFDAFYYHNRMWEIGGTSRGADKPRLNESAFGPLETM